MRSGGDIGPTRGQFAPVFLPFQAADSLRRRAFTYSLRRLDRHVSNPLPALAIYERQKLGMVELNPVMTDAGPAELRFIQPLRERQLPEPSHQAIFTRAARLARKTDSAPLNGSLPASRTSVSKLFGPLQKSTGEERLVRKDGGEATTA